MPARPLIALAAAVALLTVAAGCGSAADEESASPDGTVTVYSGRAEDLVAPLFEQFTEETGIEVEVRYADTASTATTLLEEGDRTPADVFLSQDAGALGVVGRAGLLAELPAEVTDLVPERYRATDGRWVGLTGRARVIAYDPRQVPEAELPTEIADVNDPRWAGKVGVAPTNASFQSFVTALRVTEGDDGAKAFLDGLVANDVQIREGNSQILADVESGTLAMGLINHYYWYEQGAELGGTDRLTSRLLYLKDGGAGSLVNVSGVALTNRADDDARRLVDYLLDPAGGQEFFATVTQEYPLVEGVEPASELVPLDELNPPAIDLSDLDSLERSVEMITEAGLA
ncbi:MAG: iron ABC transporter substrate-binding protein [Pseudonocardia sp.]|nr:iron ABC transporter substrate-binding protein [Pseudonocardia sp.]